MSHSFYIIWLKAASAITIAVGLVAAAASHPATSTLWLYLFDLLAWPPDGQPDVFSSEAYALNAVTGGLMAGWGLSMFLLSSGPLARGEPGTRRAMLAGILAWFLVDSAGSLAAGLPGNVVLNTLFLAFFLPPLFGLRGAQNSQ